MMTGFWLSEICTFIQCSVMITFQFLVIYIIVKFLQDKRKYCKRRSKILGTDHYFLSGEGLPFLGLADNFF